MSRDLERLVDGFRVTQTIYAAVELGIPELLADAERDVDDLAAASGADASALYRLLRALASLGVLHETDGRRFSLTELGRPLRSDVPGSLHGWVRLSGRDYIWRSWEISRAPSAKARTRSECSTAPTCGSGAPNTRKKARSSTRR